MFALIFLRVIYPSLELTLFFLYGWSWWEMQPFWISFALLAKLDKPGRVEYLAHIVDGCRKGRGGDVGKFFRV